MDAGIAAVFGALAGSISGVIGSIAAGRAQRDGVRMTVRAENFKERHQPRREAYRAFLEVLRALEARLNSPAYEDSTREEERQFKEDLDARWIDVVLAGPEPLAIIGSVVHDAVDDMIAHLGECRQLLKQWLEETDEEDEDAFEAARKAYEDAMNETDSCRRQLVDAINTFGVACARMLDRDGTERRRTLWRIRQKLRRDKSRQGASRAARVPVP
ncbi:hypothetical protein OG746_20890 [Streptomyces sp. NBC_01016]|uniref:hypothetical protein n=1 Tax=Streptomyces sp. NBC_01016 TaxID=2903720 RepID=UPI0022583F19|nr:hypothetical protein [Streptomyces sp. NBC_01016]MCX4831196.1 hypothetical protein [Streptomyces sp. NBC_01016]